MTLPETDAEFEAYLKRRTVLPNGMSDHDKLEPPKALDAIVLQEAREAIHAQQRLNRAPRWARPVALAATILLCLSILLNISLNTHRPTGHQAASGTSSREVILTEAKVAEPRATRPQVLAEPNTPAPDDSRRAYGTAVDKATAFANGNRHAQPVGPTNAAPATNSAAEKAAQFADRVGMPVQAADEAPAAGARPQAPAQVPAPVARPQEPAPPPVAAQAAPPAPAAAEPERDQAAALTKRKADAGAPQPPDPKVWLQQIAALRAAGKTAQADAEMHRFRAAFPGYPAKPDPSAASEPPK